MRMIGLRSFCSIGVLVVASLIVAETRAADPDIPTTPPPYETVIDLFLQTAKDEAVLSYQRVALEKLADFESVLRFDSPTVVVWPPTAELKVQTQRVEVTHA
jgi:hypothetical protein